MPRCLTAPALVLAASSLTTLALLSGCAAPRTTAPAPVVATPPPPRAPASQADAARRADFDAALGRWHGASLGELQARLGKPDAVTRRTDGSTVYAFKRAMPADPGTGVSRFSCTVRYAVDDRTQRVQSHQIEGC